MKRTVTLLFMVLTVAAQTQVLAADPGKDIYIKTCLVCHGEDGKGVMPGVPDITGKDGPLSQANETLLKRMTEGFQSPGSPMAMPPKGGNPAITEKQMQEVLKYLQRTFRP